MRNAGVTRCQWTRFAGPAGLCLAIYSALALIYTYPLITHLDSGFLHGISSEDAFQLAWVLAWVQHALQTNPGTLFNAPIFYPTSNALAYIDCLVPIAVLLIPVHLATDNPVVVYNLAVISSFPMSGFCMYLWALHHTGDHKAAFLAGLAFAYSPYRELHLEHLNILSAEFVPLTLLCFDLVRAKGGKKRWFAFGLSLIFGALTSLYYLAFVLVALSLYIGVLLFKRQLAPPPGNLRDAWAFVITVPILAAVLAPYLQVAATSSGPRRLEDMVFFAADVRDYFHAGPQNLLYGWSDGAWRLSPGDTHQYLFPGITVLWLAVLACLPRTRRLGGAGEAGVRAARLARSLFVVSSILSVLALGPYLKFFGHFSFGVLGKIPMPYLAFYELIPPLHGLRDVGRYTEVAMAFLALTAAMGAKRLFEAVPASSAFRLCICLGAVITLEYWSVQQPLVPVRSGTAVPAVYSWLAHQHRGPVLELPICDSRLPGGICGEEFIYMYYQTYHWQPLLNGWAGSYPKDWYQRTSALESFPSPAAWKLIHQFGVGYLIIHPDFPGWTSTLRWLSQPVNRHAANIRVILHMEGDLVLVLSPTPWKQLVDAPSPH